MQSSLPSTSKSQYKNIVAPLSQGLTQVQVRQQRLQFGFNRVAAPKHNSPLWELFARFKSPLTLLLLTAASLAGFTGDYHSSVVILAIITLSTGMDFLNSYKSDQAVAALQARVRVQVCVRREGKEISIPIEEIVPEDIVLLSPGSLIPADGMTLESSHLYVTEAALTGESMPVAKASASQLFMGTSVTSGIGVMRVLRTGLQTDFSKVVAAVEQKAPETEFDREIKAFSLLITRITIPLVIGVFIVTSLQHEHLIQALLFAIALTVGMTPELLPMIITLNLTRGSLALARRGVIVRRLSSMQNFGAMNVLCTDKTGTLTEDQIALVRFVDIEGKRSEKVLQLAYINSHFSTGAQNPLDEAVITYGHEHHETTRGLRKHGIVPFDFQRRRTSVVVEQKNGKLQLITKGAPEEMLECCKHRSPRALKQAHAEYERLSKGGFRVVAVAQRHVVAQKSYGPEDECGLELVGFLGFLDPPKETAVQTVQAMAAHHIAVKIITGDNELVTDRIAQEIGLTVEGILTGEQIKKLKPLELLKKIETTTIFARVNPQQKLQVIQALQKAGNVVGFLGDGINDAPALKAADIGISVNNATDVAKQSADIILMHKSLEDLIIGVEQGRATFVNTLKYLRMVLSSSFGNMLSMASAAAFLPFFPMLAPQLLLNDTLYDASQFAIPLDKVDAEEVLVPRRLVVKDLVAFMWVFGSISSLFDFLTFGLLWHWGLRGGAFQAGWFIESLATQVLVIHVLRTHKLTLFQSRASGWLWLSTLSAVCIGVAAVTIPALRGILKFQSLPAGLWISVGALVFVYLVCTEFLKHLWFRSALGASHVGVVQGVGSGQ